MPTGKALIEQMNSTPILPNSLAFWGLGQMGIAIKGPDAILYIDPCLTNVVEDLFGSWWYRAYPTPINPEEVTNATYLLSSHEHTDHFDPQTVKPLAKASPDVRVVATGWSRQLVKDAEVSEDRAIYPTALQPMTLPGTSIKLTAIPSAHYEKEYEEQKGYRWLGYLIEWNGVTFYHSGDTIPHPAIVEDLRRFRIDVALLPINGRAPERRVQGNLDGREAAQLAHEIGARWAVPCHYEMFAFNTADPRELFLPECDRLAQARHVLRAGEGWTVPAR